jgi:hypothetical protein
MDIEEENILPNVPDKENINNEQNEIYPKIIFKKWKKKKKIS